MKEPCDEEDYRMELPDSKLLCEITKDFKLCYHVGIAKMIHFCLAL